METIGASSLSAALAKARNVGTVEDSFTLEGCEITLQNLSPDEYSAVLHECQGLDDVDYLHTYQKQQIARSIVEINGVDLREVKFVEDEEVDPKTGEPRSFKIEKHTFLIKNVINSWKKEAVFTAYRKFTDVVEMAERKAKENVTFLLPDETAEEKYRRLLLEAKECEEDMPPSLIEHVLDEMGFMQKSTAEEARAAMEKADKFAREQEEKTKPDPEVAASEPESNPDFEYEGTKELADRDYVRENRLPIDPEEQVQTDPVETPGVRLEEPLPTTPEPPPAPAPKAKPTDPHQTLQAAIAARRQQAAPTPTPVKADPQGAETKSRAEKIAALEADAANTGLPMNTFTAPDGKEIPVYRMPGQDQGVIEIRKQEKVDPQAVIVDQAPPAGINPRYKPQKR